MKKTLCYWIVVAMMMVGFSSCDKDNTETPGAGTVEVTTSPVSEVKATTAVCGGKIAVSEAGPEVTARGVCWATQNTPTTEDSKTSDGKGSGEFRSSLSGLQSGTTYYVRAYAVTASGTAYGKAVSFTAGVSLPTVTTAEVTEISYKTAMGGGEILDAGASEVTDCGICWSKEENPTTENDNVMDDPVEGPFALPLENLESGTTYYVRAFAVSATGTGYGEQVVFTTKEESLVTIPDAQLMAYCIENFDTNLDGKLQASEAAEVRQLDCSDRGVVSLEGIENFPILQELKANDNPIAKVTLNGNQTLTRVELIRTSLTSLEAKDMPNLEALLCDGLKDEQAGSLKSLKVGGCPKLKELFCQENSIQTLTISDCPELVKLCAFRNALTTLDLSGAPKLEVLELVDNQLTSLNLSQNKALKELRLTRNKFTSLELSDLPALTVVTCDGLQNDAVGTIKNLKVNNCAALEEIWCQENQIATLSVSACPALKKVAAWRNQLTELDLSGLKSLTTAQFGANQIATAKFAGCSALDLLDIPDNRLTSIDLSGCTSLREVWMQGNKMLTAVDVSQNKALQIFRAMGCGIRSIDLSNHTALTSVWCDGNGMENLKVNGCTALTELKCQVNNINSLNVQGCSALGVLWADGNNLSSLDLSGCGALTECNIQDNRAMETLKVTGCTKLATLGAWNCAIKALDLSTCGNLELVQLNDNKLTSLAVHGKKLHDVHCVRNQIATFTITDAPALNVIWIHDNLLKTLDVSECATVMNILGVCQPAEPELHGNPLETLYVKNGQSFLEKFVPAATRTIVK